MCQTRSIYNVTDPWRWLDLELDLHFDEQALSKFDLRFDEHRRHFRFNQRKMMLMHEDTNYI